MRLSRSILHIAPILIPLGCAVAGCGKAEPATTASSVPVPAATATVQPTTAPAEVPATQPAVSSMLINQLFAAFPGAKLRLQTTDDHVTAILYSADPPNAINNDYTGNSYYLKMSLDDVKDPSQINGAEWRFKSISSDRSDSHDGIFLNGLRQQLQPIDVIVRFEAVPNGVRIRLAGEFMSYGNTPTDDPGVLTSVSADLAADVDSTPQQ